MRNLYELSREMLELQAALEQAQDIENPTEQEERIEATIKTAMARITDNMEVEVDNIRALMANVKLSADNYKQEADRLLDLYRPDFNRFERLKKALLETLDGLKQKRIPTRRFKTTVAGNGGKAPLKWRPADVEITGGFDMDELAQEFIDALPEKFLKPVVREIDKDAIRGELAVLENQDVYSLGVEITEDNETEQVEIFIGERGKHLLLR